jgi:ketosteroid isomerase-like protein
VAADDVEILRKMWLELGNPGDSDAVDRAAAERWWHAEIEYVEDPKWPGSRSYCGLDDVIEAWNGYLEVLGSADFLIEDVIDTGSEVVALVRVTGVSTGGDVPFDHLWGYVCRVRDGQLVYQRAYWDPDEALAAAGVDSS